MKEMMDIGEIGAYGECLAVARDDNGLCWWNFNADKWQQIPQSLYDELVKFERGCR